MVFRVPGNRSILVQLTLKNKHSYKFRKKTNAMLKDLNKGMPERPPFAEIFDLYSYNLKRSVTVTSE